MSLTRTGHLLDKHLKTHRPNMVRHLQKKGVYRAYLLETQERASEALVDLISRRGATYHQAWEIVSTEMVFLPDEKEVPVLPPNQMPYSQPQPKSLQKE